MAFHRLPFLYSALPFVLSLLFTAPALAADRKSDAGKEKPAPVMDSRLAGADQPSTWIATLDRSHPRLLLKDADLAALKQRAKTDPVLDGFVKTVLAKADDCLDKPALEHKLVGPRLLSVSRECLRRVVTLSLAWRWTGDDKYAKKAEENLLTVCAFTDWNPSHFLDTAEMSNAVGIGYDWLYSYLSPESRATIKAGLIRNGMEPGVAAYAKKHWFTETAFNWNQVCNGGLSVGALAIADTDPEYANVIIPSAVASFPIALASYDPDGVWMEGPGYWHYATRYTAYGLAAMKTALGTDFGLTDWPGLAVTGRFPTYLTGQFGWYLNYADSGEKSKAAPSPCMFWLAKVYNDPFVSDIEHETIRTHPDKVAAEHVIFYVPPSGGAGPKPDLDRVFRGGTDIAVFRSAWNDPNALFVGAKGGYNQVNHGHLDLGNFELDALGVRWARDLGSDDYNLPGYWEKRKGGERWLIYRMNSESHSVPMLGGKGQDEEAVAKLLASAANTASPFVVFDLTTAYPEFASRTWRGIRLVDGRRAALVQDEFDIPNEKPCEVAWAMMTDAEITPRKGGLAELTLDGKRLTARILSPAGAEFSVESAERKKPEKENKGVKRLMVRVPKARGAVRVAVLLAPEWGDDKPAAVSTSGTTPADLAASATDLAPLAEWK